EGYAIDDSYGLARVENTVIGNIDFISQRIYNDIDGIHPDVHFPNHQRPTIHGRYSPISTCTARGRLTALVNHIDLICIFVYRNARRFVPHLNLARLKRCPIYNPESVSVRKMRYCGDIELIRDRIYGYRAWIGSNPDRNGLRRVVVSVDHRNGAIPIQ